jgi:hypothetical protein
VIEYIHPVVQTDFPRTRVAFDIPTTHELNRKLRPIQRSNCIKVERTFGESGVSAKQSHPCVHVNSKLTVLQNENGFIS